jgi:hypothetical protein
MPERTIWNAINEESIRVAQTGYTDWSTQQTVTGATDPTVPSAPTITAPAGEAWPSPGFGMPGDYSGRLKMNS